MSVTTITLLFGFVCFVVGFGAAYASMCIAMVFGYTSGFFDLFLAERDQDFVEVKESDIVESEQEPLQEPNFRIVSVNPPEKRGPLPKKLLNEMYDVRDTEAQE